MTRVELVRLIRKETNCSLKEASDIIKKANAVRFICTVRSDDIEPNNAVLEFINGDTYRVFAVPQ